MAAESAMMIAGGDSNTMDNTGVAGTDGPAKSVAAIGELIGLGLASTDGVGGLQDRHDAFTGPAAQKRLSDASNG